uniref:Uncharacterized protein n=1 Tax=Cairina moschata TaxID=8855 RepID=A0A8C3GF62_CAIMO
QPAFPLSPLARARRPSSRDPRGHWPQPSSLRGGAVPVTSGPPPSSPCRPWRPARPASPWRCGSPRCWGPRPAGSPGRSAGTRGPASRRSRPPPAGRRRAGSAGGAAPGGRAICSSSVMLLRSGSPARPNSCWVMVIFSSASSESAHASPASPAARRHGGISC